ncbi:uncharacterized protein [Amphiura filiformis]|uniref:uncharacterized protein n=1 Tax=Amphiura filiformis TaxID=82378 RepID=UPI003B21C1A6
MPSTQSTGSPDRTPLPSYWSSKHGMDGNVAMVTVIGIYRISSVLVSVVPGPSLVQPCTHLSQQNLPNVPSKQGLLQKHPRTISPWNNGSTIFNIRTGKHLKK